MKTPLSIVGRRGQSGLQAPTEVTDIHVLRLCAEHLLQYGLTVEMIAAEGGDLEPTSTRKSLDKVPEEGDSVTVF